MALPQAVKKQIEQTKELEEKILEGGVQSVDQPDPSDTPTEPDLPEEDLPQDGGPVQDNPTDTDNPEEPTQGASNWEHKYRVLQGKYNAEVPRLHDEIKQLKEQNAFLTGKLELLERLVAERDVSSPENATPPELPPEVETLKENFPDIYAGVQKLLESVGAETQQAKAQVQDTNKQVANALSMVFYTQLATKVPDWEQINKSPEFIQWLQQREKFTTATRYDLLMDAFNKADVDTVAEFFTAFKEEKSASSVPPANLPPEQIVPPKGQGSRKATSGGGNLKVYKQSEIEEFYRKAALGKIPSATRRRQEAEFVQAVKDGRILYNK